MVKKVSKKRNAAAISLRSSLFRMKIIRSGKTYNRKNNRKDVDFLI